MRLNLLIFQTINGLNSQHSTKDQDIKDLISQKIDLHDDSYFLSSRDGFELVQRKQFAFHCEENTAFPIIRNTFTHRQICNLNVIPFRREKMQALVVPKKSPFHDIFAIK